MQKDRRRFRTHTSREAHSYTRKKCQHQEGSWPYKHVIYYPYVQRLETCGSILAGCKEVQIVQSLPLGPIRNALEFLRDPDIRLTSLLQFVKFCNANEISSTRFLNSTAFVQANWSIQPFSWRCVHSPLESLEWVRSCTDCLGWITACVGTCIKTSRVYMYVNGFNHLWCFSEGTTWLRLYLMTQFHVTFQ